MKKNSQGYVMKADVDALGLIDDVPEIHFYNDLSDMITAWIEQGQNFQSQPQYFSYE